MFVSGFSLYFSRHKKNGLCHFECRFRVSVLRTFFIVLPPTFLCGLCANVTLSTQTLSVSNPVSCKTHRLPPKNVLVFCYISCERFHFSSKKISQTYKNFTHPAYGTNLTFARFCGILTKTLTYTLYARNNFWTTNLKSQ